MVLYSSTQLDVIMLWTNIQSLRRFDCGFWQTSKQIYRKLQYKEKVSGVFQGFPWFGREMNLHSSTKFGIKKPWISIPWRKRLELGFWKISEQIYRKLHYRKKVFVTFPEKWFYIHRSNLALYWTNIKSLRKFDGEFWQTSKQIYMKLQDREKDFGEFQGWLHFPRKMVLYSSTKFGIIKPWANISWLRKFNLGYLQSSKQLYRELQ